MPRTSSFLESAPLVEKVLRVCIGITSSNSYDDVRRLQLCVRCSKTQGCEGLLSSFRPQYISHAFEVESNLQTNKNKTPEMCARALLGKMQTAASTAEKENEFQGTMERSHFDELVRSGDAFVASGVDLEKGREILLIRSGYSYKGKVGPKHQHRVSSSIL